MTNEQRAARYMLVALLDTLIQQPNDSLAELLEIAEPEIREHHCGDHDPVKVFPLVRRYAEVLGVHLGVEAEQAINLTLQEGELDRPHYTDTVQGYETKAEAVQRESQFYAHPTDLEQNDAGRWIIVQR